MSEDERLVFPFSFFLCLQAHKKEKRKKNKMSLFSRLMSFFLFLIYNFIFFLLFTFIEKNEKENYKLYIIKKRKTKRLLIFF